MKLARLPQAALAPLTTGLERYLAGIGHVRLPEQKIVKDQLNARGVLPEARLGIQTLEQFYRSFQKRPRFDAFFSDLRILLFGDDRPVGSAGLAKTENRDYVLKHVSLGGVDELVQGLAGAEETTGTADHQPRLIQVPQIYLVALALVPPAPNRQLSFRVISPPYPEARNARGEDAFRHFVDDLVDEHRRIFGNR